MSLIVGAEGAAGAPNLIVGAEGAAPAADLFAVAPAPEAGVSLIVRLESFAVSVDTASAAGEGAGEVNLIVGAEAAAPGAAGADGADGADAAGAPEAGVSLMVRLDNLAVSVGTVFAAGAGLAALLVVTGVAGAVAGPARGLPD